VLSDIFFVPEEIYAPSLTAAQFVAHTAPFYPKFSPGEFYRFLLALDVDKSLVMDKQSYGQQKKIMIAFGLATNTNLLILDEPTNGLDIPSKTQFRKLIASAQTESRCILISTHQVRDLDSLIDSLLVLHEGEIIIDQSLDQIVEKLRFEKLPDTTGLEVLYEEVGMPGKNAILRNASGQLSKPDIELLFNAVISGNSAILNLLKSS
jgi:ABC-2 type transport system ATP-binding protein